MSQDKRLNRTQEVDGSSPFSSTKQNKRLPTHSVGILICMQFCLQPEARVGSMCYPDSEPGPRASNLRLKHLIFRRQSSPPTSGRRAPDHLILR
jgi:hypothetical protein